MRRLTDARGIEWVTHHGEPPSRLSISTTEITIPDDWRERIQPGMNFRVELVLHIEGVGETATRGRRWYGRWLEVIHLSDKNRTLEESGCQSLARHAPSTARGPAWVGRSSRVEFRCVSI